MDGNCLASGASKIVKNLSESLSSQIVNENLRMRETDDKIPGAMAEVEKETVLPMVSLEKEENLSESMTSPVVNENLRIRESGEGNPGAMAEVERATVLPVVSLSTVKHMSESGKVSKKKLIIFMEFSMEVYPHTPYPNYFFK